MFSAGTQHLNAPGHATTIRQPATAQLLIDSLDRFQNGYPLSAAEAQANKSSSWRLNLQQVVLNGYVNRLAVAQIQFHWNLPTIILGYNDSFEVNYDGAAHLVTIAPGWYTTQELAAELQTALNAAVAGAAFTVTWNALTGVFEIDAGAGHTMFIVADITYITCQHTLGLIAGTPAAQTYSGITPTMLPTRYVDICSTYLTKYQRLKDANTLPSNITSTCIARLYATSLNSVSKYSPQFVSATTELPASNPGDSPFIITVDYTFPKQISWSPQEGISNFDIEVRDENGNLIPYNAPGFDLNGSPQPENPGIMCEYSIVLLASED